MKQYLQMLQHIKDNGIRKENRTGVDAFTVAGYMFQHDCTEGFPLLTTKKMAKKTMLVELEGFIKGITDKKWYQERGAKIWTEWCNPMKIPYGTDANTKQAMQECNDLGPIYGRQWRRFNNAYPGYGIYQAATHDFDKKYAMQYGDQLLHIVNMLKNNPNDRRMVCSAWNPQQLHMQALPPCHVLWHLTHINGVLNLSWFQRSCDAFLGVPFNIASYATLLHLLAAESGLIAGTLTGFFDDLHIYENQLNQVDEQLSRTPTALPIFKLSDAFDSIFNWTHDMVEFEDYNPQPAIKADVAV